MNFALFKKPKSFPSAAFSAAKGVPPTAVTPYMVTNLKTVTEKVTSFQRLMPKVGVYYAVKANNDPKVLSVIDPLVAGYDIASLGELEFLLQRGVSASRIRYSNPVKVPKHIEHAYALGVRYFAFDSESEIEKLSTYAPGSNVYLRLKVSDYGSKFPLSKKFGVEVPQGIDLCVKARDTGLQVTGVTFHVGSQSENVQVWTNAIELAGKAIRQLQKRGLPVQFLDLGGGFPADYGNPSPPLEDVAATINAALNKHVPKAIDIIAEPGRYIVANSTSIVTSVIARIHRSGSEWLYLDMGTFQGLIEPLEMPNLQYPIRMERESASRDVSFTLSGPSCDAFDTIGADYMLPSDIAIGDKIRIDAAGAYSLVYGSNFNGFEPPAVYYVAN